MEYTVPISRTKTGLPAITETGGATGKTKGAARLVCYSNGSKKTAIFIPATEEREEKGHAVFVLSNGDYIVDVQRTRTSVYAVTIAQFCGHVSEEDQATFQTRHVLTGGKWDIMPPESLLAVIDAAKEKSRQTEPEPLWFEPKVAPTIIPDLQRPAPRPVPPPEAGLVSITELVQTAPDEFSLGLSNGVQLLIYIKELPVMRR